MRSIVDRLVSVYCSFVPVQTLFRQLRRNTFDSLHFHQPA